MPLLDAALACARYPGPVPPFRAPTTHASALHKTPHASQGVCDTQGFQGCTQVPAVVLAPQGGRPPCPPAVFLGCTCVLCSVAPGMASPLVMLRSSPSKWEV